MKTTLTPAELRAAERRLKAQLDSSAEQIRNIEINTLEPSGDPDGQASDEGGDDAAIGRDSGTLVVEDGLVYEVQEALERIADGTYGRCEVCEQPIERERIEQIPQARTCMPCARRQEAEQAQRSELEE